MSQVNRRSFFRTAGVGALAAGGYAGATAPAWAAAPPAGTAPEPELYGTAARTAAIVGMAVEGTTGYFVTRGQTPPKLVTVDLVERSVERIDRLDRGDGGWAATISGGKVYAGTYPFPDLYGYDPATHQVDFLGQIGPNGGFVWCLATAPDGTVYAGTSPRAEAWEYQPATGDLRNLGRVASDVGFARVIAADDKFVYVGTTPIRHIIRIDRASGAMTDIVPAEVSGPGAIGAIVAAGGRVLAAAGNDLIDMAPDGSDVTVMSTPDSPRMIDSLTVAADGEVYCSGRGAGTVYRREGDTLIVAGTPNPGDEVRGISKLDDSTLVGCGGSGILWYLDLNDGSTELFDLTDTDVAGPDLAQSIALDPDGSVHVGGHFYVTVHRPWQDSSRRIRVYGEAKALLPHDAGKVLCALYPSGEIVDIEPATDDVRPIGVIGHRQQRPWEIAYDAERNLAVIASAAASGYLDGALTLLDLSSGEMEVFPGVLPDQSILSVAVVDGVAYLAGDTWGGGSVPRVRDTAQVGAFDLDTRTMLWRAEPLPQMQSMQHVDVHDGVLYGVYKRLSGAWFAMDLETRRVLHQGRVSGYGEIVVHHDKVFAATNFGDNIYCIGPGLDEAQLLVEGLVASWMTVPQLEFEPRYWHAWGLAGRELARFDLHPRHWRPAGTR